MKMEMTVRPEWLDELGARMGPMMEEVKIFPSPHGGHLDVRIRIAALGDVFFSGYYGDTWEVTVTLPSSCTVEDWMAILAYDCRTRADHGEKVE